MRSRQSTALDDRTAQIFGMPQIWRAAHAVATPLRVLVEQPAEQAVASAPNVPEPTIGMTGLSAGGEGEKGNSSRSCEQRLAGHW